MLASCRIDQTLMIVRQVLNVPSEVRIMELLEYSDDAYDHVRAVQVVAGFLAFLRLLGIRDLAQR